jgi:hypothetical protein
MGDVLFVVGIYVFLFGLFCQLIVFLIEAIDEWRWGE